MPCLLFVVQLLIPQDEGFACLKLSQSGGKLVATRSSGAKAATEPATIVAIASYF